MIWLACEERGRVLAQLNQGYSFLAPTSKALPATQTFKVIRIPLNVHISYRFFIGFIIYIYTTYSRI